MALYCRALWVGLQDSRFSDLEPRLRDLAASDLVDTDNIDFATSFRKIARHGLVVDDHVFENYER